MPDPVLLYEFSPDTVSVSLGGENAIDSLFDLHVKINSRGEAPNVGSITITIPVGAEGATADNRLSANKTLPAPVYDHTAMEGWTIGVDETNGSIVRITPSGKQPKKLTGTIEFTLQDILVNTTAGIVPITVDEFAPTHIKATFQIKKEDANRPVERFYVAAENGQELIPPVLNDVDQKVKLKWHCTDEGKNNYSFALRTTVGETWQPKDCLNRQECYDCADGTNGVLSDMLSETTTFALDVIKTEGDRRRLHSILYTNVRVEVPKFIGPYRQATVLGGRLVRLHWIARHASEVTVEVKDDKGEVLAQFDHAPIDTSLNGYWVHTGYDPGNFSFQLTAHSNRGPNKDYYSEYPQILVTPPFTWTAGGQYGGRYMSVAFTPDGRTVLVGGFETPLQLFNIKNMSAPPGIVDFGYFTEQVYGLTVTPDGSFAILFDSLADLVIVQIQDRPKPVISAKIPCWMDEPLLFGVYGSSPICVTKEGLALALNATELIFIDDVPHGHVAQRISISDVGERGTWEARSIAVTPDGLWAFVAINLDKAEIRVIDVTQRQRTTTVLARGKVFNDLAVTPDGKLLLVIDQGAQSLILINIATQQVVNTISLNSPPLAAGLLPFAIAITPDSQLALITLAPAILDGVVVRSQDSPPGAIAVIDIGRGEILTTFAIGNVPLDIALMPGDPITMQTAPTEGSSQGDPIRAAVGHEGSLIMLI